MNLPLWNSQEVATALGINIANNFIIDHVVTDSRKVLANSLFIALKGPSFNGNNFALNALDAGANVVIVDEVTDDILKDNPKVIIVNDALHTLNQLAKYARSRSNAKIIAVTGSFGKTSIKDALAHVLSKSASILATKRSMNNHLGIPITLANLHPNHKYGVIEMGMNSLGEIKSYSKMVKPDISVISNISDAHIGKVGSIDNIARAKAEIFEGMSAGGLAVINKDEVFYEFLKQKAGENNLKIRNFHNNPYYILTKKGIAIQPYFNSKKIDHTVYLDTFAPHWANNISAIMAVLDNLNIDMEKACLGLSSFKIPAGRGKIINSHSVTILDESYNAGPSSMKNAIIALHNMGKQQANSRTIAILGDMLELGKDSTKYHKELKDIIINYNIDKVYCCGSMIQYLYKTLPTDIKGFWSDKPDEKILDFVAKDICKNDIYLIKGSRGQWAESGIMSVFVERISKKF